MAHVLDRRCLHGVSSMPLLLHLQPVARPGVAPAPGRLKVWGGRIPRRRVLALLLLLLLLRPDLSSGLLQSGIQPFLKLHLLPRSVPRSQPDHSLQVYARPQVLLSTTSPSVHGAGCVATCVSAAAIEAARAPRQTQGRICHVSRSPSFPWKAAAAAVAARRGRCAGLSGPPASPVSCRPPPQLPAAAAAPARLRRGRRRSRRDRCPASRRRSGRCWRRFVAASPPSGWAFHRHLAAPAEAQEGSSQTHAWKMRLFHNSNWHLYTF